MVLFKSFRENERLPGGDLPITKSLWNRALTGLIVLITIVFSLSTAHARISNTDLIEKAKEYDLREVSIRGEIIGDVFKRGDFVWINVSDGENVIGVWASRELIKDISNPGDYKYRGDIVQISGIFHRICKQHLGELDIHAERLVVLEKGKEIYHPVSRKKMLIAVCMLFLAMVLLAWEVILKKRIKDESEDEH